MIVAVAGNKGGVAKTTSAIHLAAYLTHAGKTAAVVDADPNRTAVQWAVRGQERGRPLPIEVAGIGAQARLARECEHIVIDLQARPSVSDMQELCESGYFLVLPSTPDALGIDSLIETARLVDRFKGNYRVLFTRVPPRPNTDIEEAEAAMDGLEMPRFKTWIPQLIAFQRAALNGCLVRDVPRDERAQRGWEAYMSVGRELEELVAGSAK